MRLRRARAATTTSRRGIAGGWIQRRQPPKSAPKRALGSVTSTLSGVARSLTGGRSRTKPRRRGGKAGGIALVSATAGMAFKNRDKLMSMFSRRGSQTQADTETSPTEAGTRPTVASGDPARTGDIAPTDPGNRPDIPPPA
jgi:hypothetical protein